MDSLNNYILQESLIREFGKEISKTVKYWKPVNQQMATCLVCGKKFYHIMEHIQKEHGEI